MFNLSINASISAAHLLRDYEGPCSRLHGHNWHIRVEVLADKLDEKGIAMDFKDLNELTWQVIGKFDHNNFNDIAPFDKLNPTAENIVKYFYDELKKILPEGTRLNKICLWETEKYAVEYSE
jgi:6-pyruvoyltetrahydropterin/6-carboxytetrahydropterin synthase